MYSSHKDNPAGQPSITTPKAAPWDSPQVVILKMVPNVEPAIMISSLKCIFLAASKFAKQNFVPAVQLTLFVIMKVLNSYLCS